MKRIIILACLIFVCFCATGCAATRHATFINIGGQFDGEKPVINGSLTMQIYGK